MSPWRPRVSLCNEVIAGLGWPEQCALAAKLGYDGLEVAPFTLGEDPHRLPAARRRETRRIAEDHGITVTGLHWLLVAPKGLSITSPDAELRRRTIDVMAGLVELCADLGGRVLVHGSPEQRRIGSDPTGAQQRAQEAFAAAGARAGKAGVCYCIEPLAPQIADLLTSFDEAAEMVREIAVPGLVTMIDTSSAGLGERQPVDVLIRRALPTGLVGHIHLNDRNRKAPGQGEDRFFPILRALKDGGYTGDMSIEPFVYEPDGPTCAARAIGYVRGVMEALA
jgi:sugar phosphate isomerase/epimerase